MIMFQSMCVSRCITLTSQMKLTPSLESTVLTLPSILETLTYNMQERAKSETATMKYCKPLFILMFP